MFGNKTLLIENIQVNIDSRFLALDGLRILHFSDLHLIGPNRRFDNFFVKLSQVECDLAIVSGDMIDNDNGIDSCVEYLSCLKPKYSTFVTFGNHDKYSLGFKEFAIFALIKKFKPNNSNLLKSKIQEKGVNILDNEIARLHINGMRIKLIGIDCPFGYDRFIAVNKFRGELNNLKNLLSEASRDDYNILISHVPDLIQELDTHSINLILSSHTHGGQVRVPLWGPIFAYSSFQKKYNMGIFKYNNSYLHVSSGLGASSITPFRFRCLPRATVIILKTDKRETSL